MNILVTGGAGFIGSNFIKHMLNSYSYKIINIDKLTYAGNLKNLSEVDKFFNYKFVKGDIRDKKLVDEIFKKHNINAVINFAAESHVDRSIKDSDIFSQTNILGTQVLLDTAKKNWAIETEDKKKLEFKEGVKFVQVSTDEVYGELGEEGYFTEKTNLAPNNPYSASKASADFMVRAYNKTFGIPVNITRCANNYGPYQFPEKLIPLIINNSLNNQSLPVYGDGKQVRDWLHVKDHCIAIDRVLHKGKSGEVYNIGGNNEKKNIEIIEFILNFLGKSKDLIVHVADRLGHDRRYAIDNTKITNELGWKPSYTFKEGMVETISWYLNNKKWMEDIVSGEYLNYYEKMYGEKLEIDHNQDLKIS